nr:hypothetical protein BdHM001_36200 [Bdellovibrio sp. HM001]
MSEPSKIQKIREIVASGGRLNEKAAKYLLWYAESQALEITLLDQQIILGMAGISGNFGYWASVVKHQRSEIDRGAGSVETYEKLVKEGKERLDELLTSAKRAPIFRNRS